MGLTIAGGSPASVIGATAKDNGQTGITLPASPTAAASGPLALIANRGFLMRFRVARTMTITVAAFVVTTAAGSDDAVDVGIYDASGNKLVSSGATTGKLNGTGTKTVTLASTVLSPGVTYYGALSSGTQGGTAASVGATTGGSTQSAALYGATIGLVEFDVKATVHPLPSAWGAFGQLSAGLPLLALRES